MNDTAGNRTYIYIYIHSGVKLSSYTSRTGWCCFGVISHTFLVWVCPGIGLTQPLHGEQTLSTLLQKPIEQPTP